MVSARWQKEVDKTADKMNTSEPGTLKTNIIKHRRGSYEIILVSLKQKNLFH